MSRSATIRTRYYAFRLVVGSEGFEVEADEPDLVDMVSAITDRVKLGGVPAGHDPDPLAALALAVALEVEGQVERIDPQEEGENIDGRIY